MTLDRVNDERTVYLIHEHDAEPPAVLSSWIEQNYVALFENELEGWYVDESLWPKKRATASLYIAVSGVVRWLSDSRDPPAHRPHKQDRDRRKHLLNLFHIKSGLIGQVQSDLLSD